MRYFKIFVALAVALTATFTLNAQNTDVLAKDNAQVSFLEFANGLNVVQGTEGRCLIFDVGDEVVMEEVYVEVGYTGGFWKTWYVNTGTVDVAGTKIRVDYTIITDALANTEWGELVKDETLYEPFVNIATRDEKGETTTLLEVVGGDAKFLMN